MIWLLLIAIGVVAGLLSGLVGVGGGVIVVPALVLLLGYSQKLAQGTTLALLVPPIGILAAITYYRHGDVNLFAASMIAIGFVAGSLLGAKYAVHLSNATLTRLFAVCLLAVAVRLLISARI
jgi:uncharacterized protein